MHDLTKLADALHQAKQHVEVGGTYTHYRNQEQQYKVLAEFTTISS